MLKRRSEDDIGSLKKKICLGKDFAPRARRRDQTYQVGKTNDDDPSTYMDPSIEIEDPYFWLRDESRSNKRILNHLESENKYFKNYVKDTKDMQKKLFAQMKSYIKETDSSYPYPHGIGDFESPYQYYIKTFEGKGYCEHWRINTKTDQHECFLDENQLAEGHDFCDIGGLKISQDNKYLMYGLDYNGNEWYDMIMIDLETGLKVEHSLGPLHGPSYTLIPKSNNIYYTVSEEKTERSYQIWRYDFKTQEKVLVFHEKDSEFSVGRALSDDYTCLFIKTAANDFYEHHYIPLKDGIETGPMQLLLSRDNKIKAMFEPWYDDWLIISNKDDSNSHKLYQVSKEDPSLENWTLVECQNQIPPTPLVNSDLTLNSSVKVDFGGICCNKNYCSIYVKVEDRSLTYIAFRKDDKLDPKWHLMTNLDHDMERTSIACNFYDSDQIWVSVSSPVQPRVLYKTTVQAYLDNDPTKHYQHLDTKTAPNYNPDLYESKRIYVPSFDGELVPVSLSYRKDVDPNAPVHLYGYGSYGCTVGPPSLYHSRLFLDLGFVHAVAHVRGGAMRGEKWYLDGKMENKENTFKDFIEVAKYFKFEYKNQGSPRTLSIEGASAGGLLMGAVYTMSPDLFDVVLADVPFVDVIATMCDASIPLTTGEWTQWGNPNIETDFNHMIEYSPYDNLAEDVRYPPILLTAGLHDPRVQYWEPTKFMAKLRYCTNYDQGQVHALKTNMHKGHFSNTDRYDSLRERAEEVAFILKALGHYF